MPSRAGPRERYAPLSFLFRAARGLAPKLKFAATKNINDSGLLERI
jgi:hypothetical protein